MHAAVLPDNRGMAATHPVQMAIFGGKEGMEAKLDGPTFFTERSLATYLAVSDRTVRKLDQARRADQLQARRIQTDRSGRRCCLP
jgi:hypothetical protein